MRIASAFLILTLLLPFSAHAGQSVRTISTDELAALEKLHAQAEALIIESKFREAVRVYSDIILVEPEDDNAYANMGHAYLILGDYGRAREAFLNALHINPDNEMAYVGMQKILDLDNLGA